MTEQEGLMPEKPSEGGRWLVFDYRPWQETGDIGDNSCFFRPATVVRVHKGKYGERLIDVRFDHEPDRISRSHFEHALRPIVVRATESGSSR